MKYFSVRLYEKILKCAVAEGLTSKDLKDLSTSLEDVENLEFISADVHLRAHELLDQKLKPRFAIRVGQQMKIDDYGVLGLSWRTCSRVREILEVQDHYQILQNQMDFANNNSTKTQNGWSNPVPLENPVVANYP